MALGDESLRTVQGVFGSSGTSRSPAGLIRGDDNDVRPVRCGIAEEWILKVSIVLMIGLTVTPTTTPA